MISNLTACGEWDGCAVASQSLRLSSVTPLGRDTGKRGCTGSRNGQRYQDNDKFRDPGTCWLSDTDALKEENDRFSSANYQLSLKAKGPPQAAFKERSFPAV